LSEITNFRGEAEPLDPPLMAEGLVQALMSRVGERVREARERKGIPRRVLSETSGVSPRYLAQIEAGEGNISIALLLRVAIALDYRVEWLTTDDDPWTSDVSHAAELFRRANADVRARVMAELNPLPSPQRKARRICLVGLRGAGKSTLGAMAGRALGLPFVELNRDIAEQAGMPVTEVMALYGQEGYRRLEAQAMNRIIATHDSMILAVAGGIVSEPETYNTLIDNFHTVWLKARPEEHMERVRAQGDTRPMAGKPEAMEQLKSILTARETLYAKAEAQLDTSGKTVEESLGELLQLVDARQFLKQA
jgi:XRE family transcriptional regulator, aerobic/anaerobic benzoate catabolism transcriptional regulator